jgi:hypothetical protein
MEYVPGRSVADRQAVVPGDRQAAVLVMEYVPGRSVAEALADGPLEVVPAVALARLSDPDAHGLCNGGHEPETTGIRPARLAPESVRGYTVNLNTVFPVTPARWLSQVN